MKTSKFLALLASLTLSLVSLRAQPAPPAGPPPDGAAAMPGDISPAGSEVVRLVESGTSEDVLVAFVQNSTSPYNLSANHILYLRDIGVSSPVISAMLNRDRALGSQPAQYAPTAVAAPQQTAPAAPPAQPASQPPAYVGNPPPEVSYFYSDLSPYGTWVTLDGIGWCWQPRVVAVNRAWRPYSDSGRWVYSDCGWYWQSDYSWGWAPFHYGRWTLDARCGWVWVPDTVWGPAWVTWRVAGDNCGWAPLPPHAVFDVAVGWRFNGIHVGVGFDFGLHSDCFTFVGVKDFDRHDYNHYRLAPVEVTKIYNKTTIINNYTVNNSTIVNRGIAVEKVSAATHTQIHKAVIRDTPADSRSFAKVQTFEKDTPVVYRSQLRTPAKPATPLVAQKVDDRHPVIQHTAYVPPRVETKSKPNKSVWTQPAGSPHNSQVEPAHTPEPQNSHFHDSSEKAPTSAQNVWTQPGGASHSSQVEPARAPEPQNSRSHASSEKATPPAQSQSTPHNNYAPATTTPSYSAAAKPEHVEPSHAATAAGSEPPREYAPQSVARQNPETQQHGQNPHVYYPKSYHQAADIHSLPPEKQHGSDSHSDNHSDKSSRKNDPERGS